MYTAFITKLTNVRPHPNADRLQLAECFGNTVCVGLEYVEGQLCVYFPCDGQLSEEFCAQHNLARRKDEAGNNVGGYMDPNKRNVTAIRLRGEKSDGLAMNVSCLEYTGVDISTLKEGFAFTIINGHEICQKYIPRTNHRGQSCNAGNRSRKKKAPIAPLFAEHSDTEQLAYNLSAFRPGDLIEVTEKCHGTSQRTGYLPVLKRYKRTLWDRIRRKEGTPIYDWGYVSGTRRVILENYEGGFYGDNSFREQHSKVFESKLHKTEVVYYEVCGFTDSGTPIMGQGKNSKLGKDFVKQYGQTTTFSYGCHPEGVKLVHGCDDKGMFTIEQEMPKSRMLVYRMCVVNEDGDTVEYTPDYMRYRCEQMGVECVPVYWKGYIPEDCGDAGQWVKDLTDKMLEGSSTLDNTHIKEGVVVRIINRPKFAAYKSKSFEFKVLEGLIKESADAPDAEEAQEELKDTN